MKHTKRKFFCTLLSTILCFCIFGNITSYAKAMDEKVIPSSLESNITDDTIAVGSISRSSGLTENGILANESKLFTFYVPQNSTYTFTMSARQISGSGGVWTILQKDGNNNPIIDTNISGSYQKRFYLTSGTWLLRLTSAPGTCSYAVSISL